MNIFKSKALLGVHPLGKLPAVLIDGKPLFESLAIVTAIADLVPEKKLIAKASTWPRNLHLQWSAFALNELDPLLQSSEINTIDFIIPPEEHVPDIIEQNAKLFRKTVKAVDQHLANHDYLVNDCFSATDIIMGYTLCWGQEQKWVDDFKNVNAYMERLYTRRHCPLNPPV